jgi:putative transposase
MTFGPGQADKHLTFLRRTTTDADGRRWLAEGSSVAQQQTVRGYSAARAKALKDITAGLPVSQRHGMPGFRSKSTWLPTLNYTTRGFSLRADASGRECLLLPGGTSIPVVWSRPLPSKPSSARVHQDSLGHWYVSFVVEAPDESLPTPAADRSLGIDWGVAEVATTMSIDHDTGEIDESSTYDLPHAGHRKRAQQKLRGWQKKMARRKRPKGQPATRGYQRAKKKTAQAHKLVARQRKDDARKWSRKIVRDHRRIAVEDFRPKFLTRSTMAKKAADGAIGAVKTELIWQARKAGRDLRLVHPAHTTMDCAVCGARAKRRLPLGLRTYTCDGCGSVKSRDKNSATVMVARAGFVPADVDRVRPDPRSGARAA